MAEIHLDPGTTVALPKSALTGLLENLRNLGYETVGPQVKDNAIVYGPISTSDDLPRGYTSEQDAGRYRLVNAGHNNFFDVTPGAQSWKQYFFPPRSSSMVLRRSQENPRHWVFEELTNEVPAYALIGVRPCELAAILVQDRVFLRDDIKDPVYRARRQGAFILAVNCLHPCGTCFCGSMGTGPQATNGFDLSFTELDDNFLVTIGSEAGIMVMTNQPFQPASAYLLQASRRGFEEARSHMGRSLPSPEELPEVLLNNLDHPQFDDVAKRCLSCTNCTQVCPTCFCWDIQEINNLQGEMVNRERVWDSCFNPEYSYVFGGNTRPTTRARYRQWITHKLASWWQQFGVSGCVGCGRCITWCPAAIDITAEANALRKEVVS